MHIRKEASRKAVQSSRTAVGPHRTPCMLWDLQPGTCCGCLSRTRPALILPREILLQSRDTFRSQPDMPLGLVWQPALLEVITRNPVRGHLFRKLNPVCTSHANSGLGPPRRRLKGLCPRGVASGRSRRDMSTFLHSGLEVRFSLTVLSRWHSWVRSP